MVTDQIRLWQQELTRLRTHRCALYHEFEAPALYAGAAAHARQLGALLWADDERQRLAVHANFHAAMRDHLRAAKAALGL